ncbi:conjugative transposon protein TraM [Pedobacter puniceum]|uniref:Conjugative transposon protein TraM n=1 Tax=Pedobacter puniceum TaxID=2666136 RepID=A0A7K0FMQ8_9SPHI|nr:conjugative transposon protein TraM [Pedobacter puniceum]MRX46951.1 conjugative transposon protein TraM [Pedobacter puniceum]
MKTKRLAGTPKQRRLYLIMPLLILPFLTMAFWALGGGKVKQAPIEEEIKGLKLELPAAKFDEHQKTDKFSVYEATASSLMSEEKDNPFNEFAGDSPEEEISNKLNKLNSLLQEEEMSHAYQSRIASPRPTSEVNKVEHMMSMLNQKQEDPEIEQLDGILEKIMDIQHPGRTKEKLENKQLSGSYAVRTKQDLSDDNNQANAIKAVIHQNQEIVSGAVIKLRLLDTVYINGIVIPQNHFIYGLAQINSERMLINIKSLRYKNSILPVSLSAFDLDGIEGLFVPGTISRDASKQGVDDAIQSMQIMTMDPSLSAQAAGAGVQAIKGLFSKKVKQIRVQIKAGYQLLLKDNNQRTI